MPAEVNGYQIRESLNRWRLKREIAEKQFNDALWVYEDENKESPATVWAAFQEADRAIALLQTAQQRFNLEIQVLVGGDTMPLSMAVKLLGGAGRTEKAWRNATTDRGNDRWSDRERSRSKDQVYAQRAMPAKECARLADEAAKVSSALRAAIAFGNSRTIGVDLPAELFA